MSETAVIHILCWWFENLLTNHSSDEQQKLDNCFDGHKHYNNCYEIVEMGKK